jgi:Holliday junction resolvase RusA-like endonuclease
MIRMKPEEAYRAGLLDPVLAKELGLSPEKSSTTDASNGEQSTKKARKSPKPAASLVEGDEIPGDGRLTIDPQGVVQQAFLDLQIMPVPKERPRVVRNKRTGKIQSFTPQRTAAFHAQVHRVVDQVMFGHPLMDGPLRVDVSFKMPVPKSWPKWKQEAALLGVIRPTGRPDLDNLEKALLDAFNSHLIDDDSLVIERFARKVYAEEAGIEARVDRLLAGHINITRRQAELIMKISGICNE